MITQKMYKVEFQQFNMSYKIFHSCKLCKKWLLGLLSIDGRHPLNNPNKRIRISKNKIQIFLKNRSTLDDI